MSQSTICVGNNLELHSWMRHLNAKWHWLREQVQDGVFQLLYIPTALQRSDVLTKSLPKPLHNAALEQLGLVTVD